MTALGPQDELRTATQIPGRPSARALEPAEGVWGSAAEPRLSWVGGREAAEHWTGPRKIQLTMAFVTRSISSAVWIAFEVTS